MSEKMCIDKKNNSDSRRVLFKLSGEVLGGGATGLNTDIIDSIAAEIAKASKEGIQIAMVIGGGNFLRGAELSKSGVERSRADYMGMLATVINCLAMQSALENHGVTSRVQTAISMRQVAEPYIPFRAIHELNKNYVVIFGAGSGMPYFSTDTVAVQRALEIHCDEIVMGKSGVDGVYTADPKKDKNAKFIEKISYTDALTENLKIMDAAAISLARDNNAKMRVFGLGDKENIYRVLVGEKLGTEVYSE